MGRIPNTPSEIDDFNYTNEDAESANHLYWEGVLCTDGTVDDDNNENSRAVYEYDEYEQESDVDDSERDDYIYYGNEYTPMIYDEEDKIFYESVPFEAATTNKPEWMSGMPVYENGSIVNESKWDDEENDPEYYN